MVQFKIAVAIPTYRRRELLARLINSISTRWQVFVSDNDSSLLPLDTSFGDHVRVSHSPVLVGMFANWNRALSLVGKDCTHVFIPSDDDLFLPNAEEAVSRTLAQHPDADIVVFGCDLFDENGHRWSGYRPSHKEAFAPGDGFLKFIHGVDARMPGVLFRHDFLRRIGAFDERFELTAADSDLVQRALLLGRAVFVPEVIGLYQIWSGSLTHARQATDLWVNEIELWTGNVATLLGAGHQPVAAQIDIERYRGEILARNLLAGAAGLIARGEHGKAREFLRRHRVPPKTKLRTRLSLLRLRWRLWSRARW